MHLPPLPFEARPVRRLTRLSREEFLQAGPFTEPVVLTGFMQDWKLFQDIQGRQTPEEKLAVLGALLGPQPVSFHRMPQQLRGQFHLQQDNPKATTFGRNTLRTDVPFDVLARDVLESLRGETTDSVYMQAQPVFRDSPLFGALGPHMLPFLSESHEFATLWVGSNGQVVNLHYDDFMTIICMVNGVKRVTLFPPEQLPSLYSAPFDCMLEGCQTSMVRVLEPDFARYPRFAQALREAQVAVLEPGEVLIMPPMWWHHVESFGLNVMVNTRVFIDLIPQLEALYGNLSQGVRLFLRCPEAQRAQARALYQETVFAAAPAAVASGAVAEPPDFARHREETRQLVARLPDFLAKHLARYYEHFVFQAHGDPHPSLPGAFEAMVERNAHAPTLFPREG